MSPLKTGDPADPATDIGPVINNFQAEALTSLVEQALAEGATALVRGRTRGNLVEPTVLTGLPADSSVLRQEIFGPVALLIPFDGEEEAVRMANDTPVRTQRRRAHRQCGARGAVRQADRDRDDARQRLARSRTSRWSPSAARSTPGSGG